MRSLHVLLVLANVSGAFLIGAPAAAPEKQNGPPALTTIAEIHALTAPAFELSPPLSLTGIVTLTDASRNVVVLQDDTGAIALRPDPPGFPVKPGERVVLKASSCAPYIVACPDYPYRPSGTDILPLFEAPDEPANFRLTRMRGWIRPPTTGEYTFWVASDDSSELWLSPDASPARARKTAFVRSGEWTDRREWTRFPHQRSEKVFLKAGEFYYIEAFQEQRTEQTHLAVAWAGPGMERTVIDSKYLVPWTPKGPAANQGTGQNSGILREWWNNFSADLEDITVGVRPEGGLTVRGVIISVLAENVWPEPRRVELGQRLPATDLLQWVEGEGMAGFYASAGGSATIELVSDGNRGTLHILDWKSPRPSLQSPFKVRFRGVWEGGRDPYGHLIAGVFWSPSEKEVTLVEETHSAPPDGSLPVAAPVGPPMGGYYFTRGVVTFSGKVKDKDRLFVQDAIRGLSISLADRELVPLPEVGQAVEIGGPLLPGRYGLGINPVNLSFLGWQNMPAPAAVSGSPIPAHLDGQWVEFEGVARSLNADNTITVMGREQPLLIWIGETDRSELLGVVNSTLRLRGVMSLDTQATPVLLVPSRSFVEIIEPAPELPTKPVPLADLSRLSSANAWPHQVKVAGSVTFRGPDFFYLQDETGAARILPLRAPPDRLGSWVEAVGFPANLNGAERLTESEWRDAGGGTKIDATELTPSHLTMEKNGLLATVRARLLSQKKRGDEQVQELQAAEDIFEAVLDVSAGKLPEFIPGSVLSLTGVVILEPGSPAILSRLQLRSPSDVTLLEGPPWWTWKETTALIGVLLAVLAGSLARIYFLNRRFARQQAARLAFARAMLESQESERYRIAASLHDSLGQDLLVIRSQAHLALQSSADPSGLRRRLEEISETTLQAINEVREITHNLRPYQLDRLGLSQAIRAIARKVSENCPVIFACHVDEVDGLFDKEAEIHIYRIIQEGFSNIVKHAHATEATVVVKVEERVLSISIRDNGRGLPQSLPDSAGFGLTGIRERVEILNGTTKIDSLPGQGVNLQIELPLPLKPKCVHE